MIDTGAEAIDHPFLPRSKKGGITLKIEQTPANRRVFIRNIVTTVISY